MATTKAVMMYAAVNFPPSMPSVSRMAVTVVAGVAIRKASVAARDAPCRYSAIPVGITPQEHRGRGIPINVAVSIDRTLPLPT